MKVIVAVKRVMDYHIKPTLLPDGSAVDLRNVNQIINPFDEIALESAIQLKEQGIVSEIVVVSIGDASVQETLRHALAMGADRGLLITYDQPLVPINIAIMLEAVVLAEKPQLVFLGKQSIDSDNNQTAQMLAAKLQWAQGMFVSQLALSENHDKIRVTREVDSGLETLELPLPAVISTDLRLNQPRYASLPDIMKAKQKILDVKTLEDYAVTLVPQSEVIELSLPEPRQAGRMVQDIHELLVVLHEQEKIL